MWFEDLSHDTYIGTCRYLKSLGWLGGGHDYVMGDVACEDVELLKTHLSEPWGCFAAAGMHECELCEEQGRKHCDSRNLFVPGDDGIVFLVPGMIVHYIEEHRYYPPDSFVEVLRNCPPQGSPEFMQRMREFGDWWDAQFEIDS